MTKAPLVIAIAVCALLLIYLLPRFDDAFRKAHGRWRRRQREVREERERRERRERIEQSSSQ
jgi:hypothetical protein